MKTRILIIGLILLSGLSGWGQVTFVKTYDYGSNNSIQQTSDGGYIMTGSTQNINTSYIDLIKTNANGDTLWTRAYGYGSAYGSNVGYSVQQTYGGGYVVVGTIEDSSTGRVHVYFIKTNSNGDTLWTKSYGSTGNDYGYSVKQTLDSGFIIAGTTDSLGAGGVDMLLIKTNSIGDTLWTNTYGGIHDDYAESVELTTDGGYIIAGYTNSFGAGNDDIYLIKIDSIGAILWTKTYGGTTGDWGNSVKQTSDGGYIIAGCLNYILFYLIKTNSIGDTLWTKFYDLGTAYSVQQTTDGGYIIAGDNANGIEHAYRQVMLIKINSIGNTLWKKVYPVQNDWQSESCYSVQQTTDGGYIIAGGTSGIILLIKTDANGNSGCWEGYTNPQINLIPTQVLNTTTIVKSGCMVSNPSKAVGSGGTTVTTYCFNTGINEIKATNFISIYPNPFSNEATLRIEGNFRSVTLTIYNLMGEEVNSISTGTNRQITIQRNQLPAGMYFYKVVDVNGDVLGMGKLIIE